MLTLEAWIVLLGYVVCLLAIVWSMMRGDPGSDVPFISGVLGIAAIGIYMGAFAAESPFVDTMHAEVESTAKPDPFVEICYPSEYCTLKHVPTGSCWVKPRYQDVLVMADPKVCDQ